MYSKQEINNFKNISSKSSNNIFVTHIKQLNSIEIIEKHHISLVITHNWKTEDRSAMYHILKQIHSKNENVKIL